VTECEAQPDTLLLLFLFLAGLGSVQLFVGEVMQDVGAAQVVGERFAEPAAVLGGTGNDGVQVKAPGDFARVGGGAFGVFFDADFEGFQAVVDAAFHPAQEGGCLRMAVTVSRGVRGLMCPGGERFGNSQGMPAPVNKP